MKVISPLIFLPLFLSLAACTVIETSHEKHTVPQYTHDALITRRVKSAIVQDKALKPYAISVSTTQSVVSLAGYVPDSTLKSYAIALAERVRGVLSVESIHLIVFPQMR